MHMNAQHVRNNALIMLEIGSKIIIVLKLMLIIDLYSINAWSSYKLIHKYIFIYKLTKNIKIVILLYLFTFFISPY